MASFPLIKKILHLLNLESELEDSDLIYDEIQRSVIFRGTNLWILIFATIIASIGLNINSTAVIIGAMLISPLMGPINGMGYSIATYDFALFKTSIKNFSFAILASLLASTTYFAISPVSTAYSELLARTSPTIYDVFIALFGGLAGIVAISSRQKGNVIPGVAIATALMPPLCTAGYGLATGQFSFFFGAFYLFTINTIFIAIASVWISQLLKFPIRSIIDVTRKQNVNRAITVVITIVLLPSIYFGYELVLQEKFLQSASQYVSNISLFEGNYLLRHDIDPKSRRIMLVFGGTALSDAQKEAIVNKAKDFSIEKADITVSQGLSFSSIDEKNIEVFKLREQLNNLQIVLDMRDAELSNMKQKNTFGEVLFEELKAIAPQINSCSYAETLIYHDTLSAPLKRPLVILSYTQGMSQAEKTKVNNWMKKRLQNDSLRIIYQ
jgi:uncharacterized hydrophobic protein (TIGR00271 family)